MEILRDKELFFDCIDYITPYNCQRLGFYMNYTLIKNFK